MKAGREKRAHTAEELRKHDAEVERLIYAAIKRREQEQEREKARGEQPILRESPRG